MNQLLQSCRVDPGAKLDHMERLTLGQLTSVRIRGIQFHQVTLYAGSFFASGRHDVDGLSVAILKVLIREYTRYLELGLQASPTPSADNPPQRANTLYRDRSPLERLRAISGSNHQMDYSADHKFYCHQANLEPARSELVVRHRLHRNHRGSRYQQIFKSNRYACSARVGGSPFLRM